MSAAAHLRARGDDMTSERIKKGCRMSLAHGQPFRVFLQQLLSGTDYKRFETCMEAASRDFSERQPPALRIAFTAVSAICRCILSSFSGSR
jgi:hypothetical protein